MNCFELSHVTFAPEKNAILHDINLTIPWGADLRWVLWRFALYAGLQCISIFQ